MTPTDQPTFHRICNAVNASPRLHWWLQCWFGLRLMITAKLLPEYVWLIHILMLSAEAGVVGGLADWYAITVLFRNPFGRISNS